MDPGDSSLKEVEWQLLHQYTRAPPAPVYDYHWDECTAQILTDNRLSYG